MADLDLFAPRPSNCNLDCAFYQRGDLRSLVYDRTAHVRLRISSGPSGFCRRGDDALVGKFLPAECCLGCSRLDRSKADAAERNRSLFAYVTVHRNLDRGTRGGVHGSSTLEGKVCGARSFRRNLYLDFAYQFVRRKDGRIGISDELIQWNAAFSLG